MIKVVISAGVDDNGNGIASRPGSPRKIIAGRCWRPIVRPAN